MADITAIRRPIDEEPSFSPSARSARQYSGTSVAMTQDAAASDTTIVIPSAARSG
jgi:hypothetical protein